MSKFSRPVGIALSLALSYVFYATVSSHLFGLLPWIDGLPSVVGPLLYVLFAATLFAGPRLYTVGRDRLTTFARLALALPLLPAAFIVFIVVSSDYGFYLYFTYWSLAIFGWIAFVAIPLWLVVVARGLVTR